MADIRLLTPSMHRPPQRRSDGHCADVVSLVERRQVEIVRRAARRGCRRIDPVSLWWWCVRHDIDPDTDPTAPGHQLPYQNGKPTFQLRAPRASTEVKLTVNLNRNLALIGRAGSDNAIDLFYTLTFGRPPRAAKKANP